ncbi:MAG TPA: TQO small subunit DoxD [Chloroflexota bacterium]|nr:TQO small subunit DoxD [Chloroflexota bacterium]
MWNIRVWSALLRAAVGGAWLFEAYPQLSDRDSYLGRGFVSMVQTMAGNNPWHFYRNFLEGAVLPHAALFSYLTLVGNTLVGLCLLLGLLTPYSALLAVFLNINYGLAAGWMDRMDYALNGLMLVAEIVIIAHAAGRIGGVDALLRAPAPKRRRY